MSSTKVLIITELRGKQYHTMRPEIELLCSLQDRGFEVTIMTNGDTIFREQIEQRGIRFIPFYPDHKLNRNEIDFIRSEIVKGGYDMLYLVTDNRAIMAGIRAARGLDVKVAVYRGYAGNLGWYDPTSYLKHLNRRVDLIVCNGPGIARYMRRQLFFGPDKTVMIRKGHDLAWYKDVKPTDLNTLGIPDDAFVITWVGHNRPRMKGLDTLLRATYTWPSESKKHLILIGSNTRTEENLRLAKACRCSSNIHFHEPVDDPRGLVAASDVAVLPSVKGEGTNRFVMEALAMGVPVIISDIPENAGIVEQGKSGLVVPPGIPELWANAIDTLATDSNLRQGLSQGGRKAIAHDLSFSKSADLLAEAFHRLCNS